MVTNLDYLKNMSGGDEAFIRDMVQTFVDNTPRDLAALEKHLAAAEWKELGTVAHRLKPNLAFMGISSLSETILKLEKKAKAAEDLDLIPEMVAEVKNTCYKAMDELQIYL